MCWLLWAPAPFCSVCVFVCLVPFVCVGRYAFLTGGNACLPFAGVMVVVCLFAASSCTVHEIL